MTSERPHFTGPLKAKKPFDLLGFVFRRSPLIFVLSMLVFALILPILPVVIPKSIPSYMASGQLLIDPGKETTLTGREKETIPGNLGDFTRTLVQRVGGRTVITDALRRMDKDNWPDFLRKNSDELGNVIRIQKHLRTVEIQRTYLIDVFLKSTSPKGIAELLNNIMQSLLDELHNEQGRQNERRMTYLKAERTKIAARIDRAQQQLLELAEQVDNKAFLHEGYTAHLSRLEQIQRLYLEAYRDEVRKESELSQMKKDRKAIEEMSLQPFADERVADNFGINRIEQWTYEQLQQLRTTIDGLTTNNADRVYVEQRMKAMTEYLIGYKQKVNDSTIANLIQKRRYELDEKVVLAQHAYEAAVSGTDELREQLENAVKDASEVSYTIFRAADSTYDINQLRERLTALNVRIDDCEMASKAPVRVSIQHLADTPSMPSSSKRPQFVLMALVFSFGAMMSLFVFFDFMDNRLRSIRDMRMALGGGIPLPVTISNGPLEQITAESDPLIYNVFKDIAVRLNYDYEQFHSHRFLLTGLNPKSGTSAVALNLSQLLSRYVHRIALLKADHSEENAALTPNNLLTSAVMDTERRIDVIHFAVPLEKAHRQKLSDALNQLDEQYDIIILDAPPLLESDLTRFLAQHADAALLVAREDVALYRDLVDACNQLVSNKISALTAILNMSQNHSSDWYFQRFHRMLSIFSRVHMGITHRLKRIWSGWRMPPAKKEARDG
ncbi:MAG: hypothetical protein EOL87_03210 [Spartobacteria bacterium]|nr:hypothetical protein [Spartobacteria bacterium]